MQALARNLAMILATLHDPQDALIGRVEAAENGDSLVLTLELEPQFSSQWINIFDALSGYTLRLGLDGVVFAYKVENGIPVQRKLSDLIGTLSRGELRFRWEQRNIECAHDLETKIRKQRGKRPTRSGDLIEAARNSSGQGN
jgi:hypothetical protein